MDNFIPLSVYINTSNLTAHLKTQEHREEIAPKGVDVKK